MTLPSIPRSENGDRLAKDEFKRRYDAMPRAIKAELIEVKVYVASEVRWKSRGEPDDKMNIRSTLISLTGCQRRDAEMRLFEKTLLTLRRPTLMESILWRFAYDPADFLNKPCPLFFHAPNFHDYRQCARSDRPVCNRRAGDGFRRELPANSHALRRQFRALSTPRSPLG